MRLTKRNSLLVVCFLVLSYLFISFPENGNTQENRLGCCITGQESCHICEGLNCAISLSECGDLGGNTLEVGSYCFFGGLCSEPLGSGCCVLPKGDCADDVLIAKCQTELDGTAWINDKECVDVPRCIEPQDSAATSVPVLSGWGIVSLVVLLGVVGLGVFIARRKKATA